MGQSLSPVIHTFIGECLEIPLTYDKRDVMPQNLASFVRDSRRNPWGGFSVTLPHKETILPLLDRLDTTAEAAGAVNTIVRRNRMLIGYNTDVTGLREALRRSGVEDVKEAVIVGAGGAARAGLTALADMRCSRITVLNRTPARTESLIRDFQGRIPSLNSPAMTPEVLSRALSTADLLINATPVGMQPDTERSPLQDPAILSSRTAVMDMVPNPPRTLLLLQAKQRGCLTISGLDMLIAQAIAAQEIWQGRRMPAALFDDCKRHLLELEYE